MKSGTADLTARNKPAAQPAVACTEWLDIMLHARKDYQRIQDPALENPDLIPNGSTPIAADEPVFLLRAKDKTASQIVRAWAKAQLDYKDFDPEAVKLALDHADLMDQWPTKKTADV